MIKQHLPFRLLILTSFICFTPLLTACNQDDSKSEVATPSKSSQEIHYENTGFDAKRGAQLSSLFKKLTNNTKWNFTKEIKMKWLGGHPQGLVKVGDYYYVSTVNILEPTVKYPQPIDNYDRSTGAGNGYLIKFDSEGNKIKEIPIGKNTQYHPGGIDFDGKYIWVTTAEYRPNSSSTIWRINTQTDVAEALFSYPDHLGGISRNVDNNSLITNSWGSRRFYSFNLDSSMKNSKESSISPAELSQPNTSLFIDFQDTKYLGDDEMLATGLSSYQINSSSTNTPIGGLEIIDLKTMKPIWQVPIKVWSPITNRSMLNNPTWWEATDKGGLRGYWMPDDDADTTLYIYETDTLPDSNCFACKK